MNNLLIEVVRFSNFLNHRPNIDELLSRLATDFLMNLKPTSLAIASLITPTKFKVLNEYGAKGKSEALLANLASDFFTDNLVQTLMDQNLIKAPKDNKTLITPISNGKVTTGVVLCECEKQPNQEETEAAKAILLLTSSYLFLKVADNGNNHSISELTVNPLTPRQRQVLAGFIEGKTNHELALELGFSISTIRHETMAIFKTLGASDRKEAAKIAQEHGLI
jgi:DNA-binding CsgD family transcriptional regulator